MLLISLSMSVYGVVSTLQAPELSSAKQSAVIQFETDYSMYVKKVNDVNRSRPSSSRFDPATIRQCLRPSFLNSLCIMGRIEGANSSDEATDSAVKKWYEKVLGTNAKDLSERVRSAVKSVGFNKCEKDPQGNVTDFVLNIIAALDRNNASEVIQECKACENLIKDIIAKLQPPELRMRLLNEQLYWPSEQRGSISYFEERAGTLAVETFNGECARQLVNDTKTPKQHGKKRHSRVLDVDDPTNIDGKDTSDGSKSSEDDNWDTKCLNPDCDGIHRLRDCPNTSSQKKKELLCKYYSNAKKKRRTQSS